MRLERNPAKTTTGLVPGLKVDLIIVDNTELGYKAVVNNQTLGILYHNEVFQELEYGQEIPGYVKQVREDGRVDLLLQATGHRAAVDNIGPKILELLAEKGGFVAINDKTHADEIYRLFGVSMTVVASPELVDGDPPIRKPEDLAHHVLLHDDAMELVAGGNAWQRWVEAAGVADKVDAARGPHFSSNILSLEAASQKLGLALALRPLVDYDIASMRLRAPFDIEMKPQSAYFLVCPEVIADRPAVAAFRAWLLEQAEGV
jgi:hypothetical protein